MKEDDRRIPMYPRSCVGHLRKALVGAALRDMFCHLGGINAKLLSIPSDCVCVVLFSGCVLPKLLTGHVCLRSLKHVEVNNKSSLARNALLHTLSILQPICLKSRLHMERINIDLQEEQRLYKRYGGVDT